MKKTLAEEAYNLVKTMSAAEKKYFKRSLVDRSDGKLKKVFDIINGMEHFDQQKLNETVRKNYSDTTAAYNQIISTGLRTLGQFNQKLWKEIELNMLLTQARVALERKLIPTFEKLVKRGFKMAEENDLESYRFMFLELSMVPRIELTTSNLEYFRLNKTQMIESTDRLKVSAEIDFQRLRLMWIQAWPVMTLENWQRFNDESEIFLRLDAQGFLANGNLLTASRLFLLRSATDFVLGNWEGALKACNDAVDALGHPKQLPERVFLAWSGHMRNILNISKVLDKRTMFLQAMDELRKAFADRGMKLPEFTSQRMRLHEVGHLARAGELEKAVAAFDELIENQNPFLNRSELECEKTYVFFMMEEYGKVLASINKLLVEQEDSLDNKMIWSLRWLEVFASFMLEDRLLYEAKVRALKRILKKNNSGFVWEAMIINRLNKSFGKNIEEQKKQFTELLSELEPMKYQLRSCFTIFDPFNWFQSKAEGLSEVEYLKIRYV
ncbi:MAG: hypothetical protein GC178_10745 [Flavobacteriales bacterium]|nr:hypothetical protein [Flavobacteriales bacterium]